jgi:uncharacterized membrane protein
VKARTSTLAAHSASTMPVRSSARTMSTNDRGSLLSSVGAFRVGLRGACRRGDRPTFPDGHGSVTQRHSPSPAPYFFAPPVRPIAAAAALVEIVADKLPSTPPRTQARGLVLRISLGALSAGLLTRSPRVPTAVSAAVGAGAAVGAAFAGMTARGALARRMPPLAAALLEDLVAIVLAVLALRLALTAKADDTETGGAGDQPEPR